MYYLLTLILILIFILKYNIFFSGVKDFSNWPTIPQVFINGQFVGGCDIMLQMHQSGDLIEELTKAGIQSTLLNKQESQNEDKVKTK